MCKPSSCVLIRSVHRPFVQLDEGSIIKVQLLRTLTNRISSLTAKPAVILSLAAALTFAMVLTAAWTTQVGAQCSAFGTGFCASGGTNPCAATTCTATGVGYLCDQGAGSMTDEVWWDLTNITTPWPRCQQKTSSTLNYTCSESFVLCGVTHHWPKPSTNCDSPTTCIGTWSWTGCQGAKQGQCP